MKTMRERFDEKYKESVLKAYPESQESHMILLADIKNFIEQEIKKDREEIVEMMENKKIKELIGLGNFNEFATDIFNKQIDKIINTIKKRV